MLTFCIWKWRKKAPIKSHVAIHAKILKTTVFEQRFFRLPLLDFALTPMVWKLIPSAIFPNYFFGNNLSQWFLFGAKQLRFLPLDLSLKYEAFTHVRAAKNQRLRAFPNGLDVRRTECNVRDFQRCQQTRFLPLTFLCFERLVVNAGRLSPSCSK